MASKNSDEGIIKKFLTFAKQHKALVATIGSVLLWILIILLSLGIVIFFAYSVISMFSTFLGIDETDLTSGNYNNKNLEELKETSEDVTSCYGEGLSAFWNKTKDWITPGVNSGCEAVDLIRKITEEKESKYSAQMLEISPGLVVSTIINVYGNANENYDEDGTKVSASSPIKVLDDITKEGYLTKEDIQNLIDQMVLEKEYWYYTCEMTSSTLYDGNCNEISEDDVESLPNDATVLRGKRCVKGHYKDAYFDRTKFEIYLRYGESVSAMYEAIVSYNDSLLYTCEECYEHETGKEFNSTPIEISDYLKTANPDTNTSDDVTVNISQEVLNLLKEVFSGTSIGDKLNSITAGKYDYYNGYIYKTYELLNELEKTIFVPKTIEKNISVVLDYESLENEIYGSDEIEEGTKGLGQTIETKKGATFCTYEQSCNCPNGNLCPTLTLTSRYNDENGVCKILTSDQANIRLVTCPGVEKYKDRLPGGYTFYKNTSKGAQYIANDLITWSEYIKGVATAEINGSSPVEAVKFQMLIAQSYALNRYVDGSSKFYKNSSDEIEITIGTCAQSYSSPTGSSLEEALEDVKENLLIDSDGSITYSAYRSDLQNTAVSYAKRGESYEEILDTNYVRNYTTGGANYSTAQVMTCGSLFKNSEEYVANLIINARKYVGMNRQVFSKNTGVDTSDSWCAKFVSYVIKQTPNSPITISSASVSTFLNYFVNSGRFCDSAYWSSVTGKFSCTNSPEPGDIIMTASEGCNYSGTGHVSSKSANCIRHIGIVSAVSEDSVTYIHGNTERCSRENGVCESTRPLNESEIIGYGR